MKESGRVDVLVSSVCHLKNTIAKKYIFIIFHKNENNCWESELGAATLSVWLQ